MKKLLLSIVATFLIATPVFAYSVKSGETPFGLWGSSWRTELAKYGISDPHKLPVGLNVTKDVMLGASLPIIQSLFQTSLLSPITISDTSMTLVNGTDRAGNVLSGYYCFTLDSGTPSVEYICGTASSTSVTGLQRGIDPVTGNTTVLALRQAHRRGTDVRVTDYPSLALITRMLSGQESIPGTLYYQSGNQTYTSSTAIATQGYVNGVGAGGFTSANVSTTRGLSTDGSAPEKVGVNASSTTGMSFDASGKLYQKVSSSLYSDSNGIGATVGTLSAGGVATSTATANLIPIANASGKLDSWITQPSYLSSSFLAGEDIATSSAVCMGAGGTYNDAISQTGSATNETFYPTWYAQTFTNLNNRYITGITFKTWNTGGGVNNFTASIRAVAGNVPTGSDLQGITGTINAGGGFGVKTITFPTPVKVSPNTQYAIVLSADAACGIVSNSDSYAGGNMATSTNNGSTWGAITGKDLYFGVNVIYGNSGSIYACSATASSTMSNNFLGFNSSAVASSSYGNIVTSGVFGGLTGLNVGSTYYLADIPGMVSSTQGTISRKIGLSVSSTAILIKHDNP